MNECTSSYQNYASFRRHLKRQHTDVAESRREEFGSLNQNDNSDETDPSVPPGPAADAETNTVNPHQRALFLLKAREVHKFSEQALSDIMTDFTVMVEGIVDDVHDNVEAKLRMNNISTDGIGLNEVFNDPRFKDPFCNFSSEYLRSKYFSEHMMLIVCALSLSIALCQVFFCRNLCQ